MAEWKSQMNHKEWFCSLCDGSKNYTQGARTSHIRTRAHHEKADKKLREIAAPVSELFDSKSRKDQLFIANLVKEVYLTNNRLLK